MNRVDLSPLASIRGVSKHLIGFLLRLFKMPTHKFRVPRVREQTFKRAITGRYRMTMAGIFLFFLALEEVSSTSAKSSSSSRSSLRLYLLLLHTRHLS